MSENTELDTLVSKADLKNEGILEIRAEQGSTGKLEIYFRHPVLANVIEKMGMGNYDRNEFAPVYKEILMDHPDPKAKAQGRVVSRPAIYSATKNFEGAVDFDFARPPRGVLISNPEAIRKGFSLVIELKAPVPQDTLRKWGKMFMDGCADIISASKPFRIQWVMTESPLGTV